MVVDTVEVAMVVAVSVSVSICVTVLVDVAVAIDAIVESETVAAVTVTVAVLPLSQRPLYSKDFIYTDLVFFCVVVVVESTGALNRQGTANSLHTV